MIFLQATKTKVKGQEYEKCQVLPDIDQKDQTFEGEVYISWRPEDLLNASLYSISLLSSLVGCARSGLKKIQELDSPNQQNQETEGDFRRPYYD